MKHKTWPIVAVCLLVIALALAGNGFKLGYENTKTIPTPTEIQEFLANTMRGDEPYYKGKIDGIIGTETMEAWFSYCSDKSAAKYMTETGAPEK